MTCSGRERLIHRSASERTSPPSIWREDYQQEDRVPRRFEHVGNHASTVAARRRLDS